jgi:hypothetical protein
MGMTAQLAEARRVLRAAAPDGSWDAVLAEVQRLQHENGVPLLAALHAVYAKLASGWRPAG